MTLEELHTWSGGLYHARGGMVNDWGFICDQKGDLIMRVCLPTHNESVLADHRRAGTDPTQARVDRILAAINAAERSVELDQRAEMFESAATKALAERDAAIAREKKMREALEALLSEFDALMEESSGVYGLHLNGDNAPWGEITDGGAFARLPIDGARAALAETEKVTA